MSQFPWVIPGHDVSCLYQVIKGFLVYTRSSEEFLFIPGHLRIFLRIPGHQGVPCLYQVQCAIHTSGWGVVGAFWAGITLKSDSEAVCVSGAWASSGPPAWEMIHGWEAVQHG